MIINLLPLDIPRVIAACLVFSCAVALAQGAENLPVKRDPLFDGPQVVKLTILISSDGVESLKTQPKKDVRATIIEGGRSYTNVVVHLKGLGSFRPITEKPSFSIKFDEFIPDVRFHGHARILLENSSQDTSFLRRKLTSELFLRARVPAARVAFATVRLNGRDLGLYTLSEAMNKAFLRRHFGSDAGNLYEGSNEDVSGKLEQDSGDSSTGRAEVRALVAACEEPNLSTRWTRLQSKLDVERFITFMALEVLICHHDGYSMDLNNFRLYHDPATDRIVFIPHGMDLVFNRANIPLEPDWTGLVARRVMETAEGRAQYRERIQQLAVMVYGGDSLHPRIKELAALLQPVATASQDSETRQFSESVIELQNRIRARAKFVFEQLRGGDGGGLPSIRVAP